MIGIEALDRKPQSRSSKTDRVHHPMRMCVACRTRKPGAELLRFRRRPDGQVTPGIRREGRVGRGAYVCPSKVCMEVALRRRALASALGGPARLRVLAPDASALWPETAAEIDREVECLRTSSVPPRSFPVRLPALLTLQRRLCEQGEGA